MQLASHFILRDLYTTDQSVCAQYYGQGGLSMGAGAGIAIGVIAFVGVLLAFAALWRRRTSRCISDS